MGPDATSGRRILLLGALALAAGASCRKPPPPAAIAPQRMPGEGLQLFPSLSPDGARVAYSAVVGDSFEIHVRDLAGGPARRVTADGQQNVEPAWSPDGRQLAFHSGRRGGIWIVDDGGGPPRPLAAFGSRPAWSPDGKWIALQLSAVTDVLATSPDAVAPSTIWVTSAKGGALRELTKIGEPRGGHGAPAWTPDGRSIVFSSSDPQTRVNELWSVRAEGGKPRKLAEQARLSDPAVGPTGEWVYFSGVDATGRNAIWRVPARGEAASPVAVSPLVTGSCRHFSLSRDGRRAVWSELDTRSDLWSLPLDADGRVNGPAARLTSLAGRSTWPLVSPNGRLLAFSHLIPGGARDVYVVDRASGEDPKRLVDDLNLFVEDWFPDSARVLLMSDSSGGRVLSVLDLATRSRTPLGIPFERAEVPRLSPDGTRIAYHAKGSGVTMNLWITDLASGRTTQVTFDREFVGFPCWSPDGTRLAAQFRRGDEVNVLVVSASGGDPTPITNTRGQSWPFDWFPDGRRIAFAGWRDGAWNLFWVDRETRKETRLTSNRRLDVFTRYPGVTPDGREIVYELARTEGSLLRVDASPAFP